MRTPKPSKLNVKFQTVKTHNWKYCSYPKTVRDVTQFFRTAKRANRMAKIQCLGSQKKLSAGRGQVYSEGSAWRGSLKRWMASSSSARLLHLAMLDTGEKNVDITRLSNFSFRRIIFSFVQLTFQMTELHRKMKAYPISSEEMVERLMDSWIPY